MTKNDQNSSIIAQKRRKTSETDREAANVVNRLPISLESRPSDGPEVIIAAGYRGKISPPAFAWIRFVSSTLVGFGAKQ